MKTRFKVFALGAVMAASLSANAGFLIEPYLGYGVGKVSTESNTNVKSDADSKAVHLGARAGLTFTALFVAADYSMLMSGNMKDDTSDFDYTGTQLGVTVGLSLPVVRIWAGYGLQDELKDEDDNVLKGSNIKIGFGFDLFPMVDMNFEYIMSDYNKYGTGDFSADYNSYKINTALVSLSVPF